MRVQTTENKNKKKKTRTFDMLLIDFSQIFIANIMQQLVHDPHMEIDEPLVRHMVLTSILAYKKKFSGEYGLPIICCDTPPYWRKTVFPHYKAHRKTAQAASNFDWDAIFTSLNTIRQELVEYFPYRVMQVPGAEADDIIACLCKAENSKEMLVKMYPIMIISGDKDFSQLQKYPNVKQFSPRYKSYIECSNPAEFVKLHIMEGDASDGIPNFLSPDNSIVDKIRQKALTQKNKDIWIKQDPKEFCEKDAYLRGYQRNQELIDFDRIPEKLYNEIINTFVNQAVPGRGKLLSYFMEKRLRTLLENIQEF